MHYRAQAVYPATSHTVQCVDGIERWGGVFNLGTIEEPKLFAVFFERMQRQRWQPVPVQEAEGPACLGSPDFKFLHNAHASNALVLTFATDAEQAAYLDRIGFAPVQLTLVA